MRSPPVSNSPPLTLLEKLRLAHRIWRSYALVRRRVFREPLPELVATLAEPRPFGLSPYPPPRLSRAVHRTLRVGRRRPTCLVSSLVLFRLLREQGDPAQLVIGLPPASKTHEAHAWIEIDGRDIGPPPGRGGHAELARFG